MDKRYCVTVSVNGVYIPLREYQTDQLSMAVDQMHGELLRLWRITSTEHLAPGNYEIKVFDQEEDCEVQRAIVIVYEHEGVKE